MRERLLPGRGRRHRSRGVRECIEKRIALGVDLDAAVCCKRRAEKHAVVRERLDIAVLAEFVDQPRRSLNVGEEEVTSPRGSSGRAIP